MHLFSRYLSVYIDFLRSLKSFRTRLIILITLCSVFCIFVANRPYAPLTAIVILYSISIFGLVFVFLAILASIIHDTIFLPENFAWLEEECDKVMPLNDGEGVPGKITALCKQFYHKQYFSIHTGGILLQDGTLKAVIPLRTMDVISGISKLNCENWWSSEISKELRSVKTGTLYVSGFSLYSIRFTSINGKSVTFGTQDKKALKKLWKTCNITLK